MTKQFSGGDVNRVLKLVASLSDDSDIQLSILTIALATACRSCGVDKEAAMSVIRLTLDDAFENPRDLVPLDQLKGDN